MPSRTDHQITADALHQAFLINLIAEAEAELYNVGSDSEYSSSSQSSAGSTDSSSSLSSSNDEDVLPKCNTLSNWCRPAQRPWHLLGLLMLQFQVSDAMSRGNGVTDTPVEAYFGIACSFK